MRNKANFVFVALSVLGVSCATTFAGHHASTKATAAPPAPAAPMTIGGATFSDADVASSSTSTFDPFLRVRHSANEQASNVGTSTPSSGGKSNKSPVLLQQTLQQSSLATLSVNGVECYKFVLAATQTGKGQQTLSLTSLQISTSSTLPPSTGAASAAATDSKIAYSLNVSGTGSPSTTGVGKGVSSIYAYIPVSLFDQSAQYVTLSFAASSNYNSKKGFEEWSAATGPRLAVTSVPDQSSTLGLAAIALGLVVVSHRAWSFRRDRITAQTS